MSVYQQLLNKETKLSVVGLGYVGMPIAVAFAKQIDVIGYDYNAAKIAQYQAGIDPTKEVGDAIIQTTSMEFTNDATRLKEAKFHIVAVPTPINLDKTPDLTPVTEATKTVAQHLSQGAIVVYESTVYPGVTEDICIPLLEQYSGLTCGKDFHVGYSPERINPGDKVHTLENIIKIVSATDDKTLDEIAKVYEIVIQAGVHRASTIKVAEAAKVVENSQRDINIAFMNELALVFDRMGIDTAEVIEAMNTKWNALGFRPGLVGGHCIGVDPYYFVHQAEKLGYHSQIILAGRKINDSMGEFIADAIIKQLILTGKKVIDAKVVILGLTFKENCPDTRNSKVADVLKRLNEYGIQPVVIDAWASPEDALHEYGVQLATFEDAHNADCLVFAVGHQEFTQLSMQTIDSLFKPELSNAEKIIIDVKSILDKQAIEAQGYTLWRL
ncbi:MAG: nucleotide sugar dehydrogenase [Aerococcaceae bacterium]|nr:nucleotide sugar dehydrogenase [Aerococcaceae bacterium]